RALAAGPVGRRAAAARLRARAAPATRLGVPRRGHLGRGREVRGPALRAAARTAAARGGGVDRRPAVRRAPARAALDPGAGRRRRGAEGGLIRVGPRSACAAEGAGPGAANVRAGGVARTRARARDAPAGAARDPGRPPPAYEAPQAAVGQRGAGAVTF